MVLFVKSTSLIIFLILSVAVHGVAISISHWWPGPSASKPTIYVDIGIVSVEVEAMSTAPAPSSQPAEKTPTPPAPSSPPAEKSPTIPAVDMQKLVQDLARQILPSLQELEQTIEVQAGELLAQATAVAAKPREEKTAPPPLPMEKAVDDPSVKKRPAVEKPFEEKEVVEKPPEEKPKEKLEEASKSSAASTPSVARIGVVPQARGVRLAARFESSHRPKYPAEAIRRQLEGLVVLKLTLSTRGSVIEARVSESSGHPLLDAAAIQFAKEAAFSPARVDGVAVESVETLPIRFRLTRVTQ